MSTGKNTLCLGRLIYGLWELLLRSVHRPEISQPRLTTHTHTWTPRSTSFSDSSPGRVTGICRCSCRAFRTKSTLHGALGDCLPGWGHPLRRQVRDLAAGSGRSSDCRPISPRTDLHGLGTSQIQAPEILEEETAHTTFVDL